MNSPESGGRAEPGSEPAAGHRPSIWRRAIPYAGTALIFLLIFWRIPVREVLRGFAHAPILYLMAVFLPFSAFYFMVDSACLTWVVNRFNASMSFREILPIRASMYLLALINTNLGQGGVAYYLHRKARIPLLEAVSSVLFIAILEIYQLFLFSTLGVIFYSPTATAQVEIVGVLRVVYVVAWTLLGTLIAFFAAARRRPRLRGWIEASRAGGIAGTFLKARPRDYAAVLAIKAPSFAGSVVAHYLALRLYGIPVPFFELLLFLPLVFLAAALPIAVAHLGTSQAAWLLFFSGSAPAAEILAYSLVAHFIFMLFNGLFGLIFLPQASRELTAVQAEGELPLRAEANRPTAKAAQ